MAKPPGMELHGSGWRVTKRVPKDLLAYYAPRKFLRYQTGEPDRKAAEVLAWRWLAEVAEEFQRIRTSGSPHRKTIEPSEVSFLVASMVRSSLGADEEGRAAAELATDEGYAASLRCLDALDSETRLALSRRIFSGNLPMVVEDWLQGHGYAIQRDSETFRGLCLGFAKGAAEAVSIRRARNAGNWIDTPPPPVLPLHLGGAPDAPLRLSAVVASFMGKQDESAPMFKKYAVATRLLLEVLGDRPVSTIKQKEIDDFFGLLCRLPPRWPDKKRALGVGVAELAAMKWEKCLGPKAFDDSYMAALRPFFRDSRRVFGDQGFPPHLTTEGIKYSGEGRGGEDKQRPLRLDELKRLFEGGEFASFAEAPEESHRYWLPLIGLYTGARVNEVCQLNPQCDIREDGGMWAFAITEESATDARVHKSVKNATSRRLVPIHSELLRLGLLAYVQAMREQGHALLFPQFPPTRGKASGTAEKWFRGFLKDTGLRDDTEGARVVGFHAFRHTLLNRAANLGVENAEWITGHAPESVSSVVRGYRGELEMTRKRDILERITFEISPPLPVPSRT